MGLRKLGIIAIYALFFMPKNTFTHKKKTLACAYPTLLASDMFPSTPRYGRVHGIQGATSRLLLLSLHTGS